MTYSPNRQCRSCGATSPEALCMPCIARIEAKDDFCASCGAPCPVAPSMECDPRCDDCLNRAGLPINGREMIREI
jgi:hypothetical protein